MVVKVKKIWNKWASVRSPIVSKILEEGDDLIIKHAGDTMTITNEELNLIIHQVHKTKFYSKYDKKWYELYDFIWEKDNDSKEKAL